MPPTEPYIAQGSLSITSWDWTVKADGGRQKAGGRRREGAEAGTGTYYLSMFRHLLASGGRTVEANHCQNHDLLAWEARRGGGRAW